LKLGENANKRKATALTAKARSKAFTPSERVTFLCLCKEK